VGIEASGQSQWFERMLAELGHEVWIGDAAKIRASCERKQKTDRRDADAEASGGGSLSADLGAHGGRAGRAAVALAPSQAGTYAHAGEKPAAGAGAEPWCATEVEAVERDGKKAAGVAAAAALGQPAEGGASIVLNSRKADHRKVTFRPDSQFVESRCGTVV
jgi:hypothetical protein